MAIVYQNDVAGKICANPDCGWNPLSKFHQKRLLGISVGDGYKSRCRDCFNAQKRAERAAKPEKYRATAQKYVEANKEHIQNLKRSHQRENPEKYDEAARKYWITQRRNQIQSSGTPSTSPGTLSRDWTEFIRTPRGRTSQVFSRVLQASS
jgi:hypothetical protein